jgi:hypothetical protein
VIADKEYEAFRAMFLAQFARLAEQAGRYISRMSNDDRGLALATALHLAWINRKDFNPGRQSLLVYWNDCLKLSLQGQKTWLLRYLSGWEPITSEQLLAHAAWRTEDGE